MTYFISDLHLGDERAFLMDHRPFASVEEMDQTILRNWKKKVRDEDDVYLLGDIIAHNVIHDADYYLDQLNGHLHLIKGNHDHTFLEDERRKRRFDSIDDLKTIFLDDKEIMLTHYPLADWNGRMRGVYQIYGHIHGFRNDCFQYMREFERAMNCGCMLTDYTPVTFDELVEINSLFRSVVI